MWEMGKILEEAQEKLASYGDGTFISWVENEAGLQRRHAYRLIYIHRAFDLDTVSKTNFGASVLYILSEPATPREAREEAVYRAERGEAVSPMIARDIVQQYRPLPPSLPPQPPMPPLPEKPPSPEYQAFEEERILPHLHDAGRQDAPQVLSGKRTEPIPVPEEKREQATESLRSSIVEVVLGVDTSDEDAVEAAADAILSIVGQNYESIAIAARLRQA